MRFLPRKTYLLLCGLFLTLVLTPVGISSVGLKVNTTNAACAGFAQGFLEGLGIIDRCGTNSLTQECRATGNCTDTDRSVLEQLNVMCTANNPACTPEIKTEVGKINTTLAANDAKDEQPPECASSYINVGDQFTCSLMKMTVSILAAITWMCTWILFFSDQLLSVAVQKTATIQGFNTFYNALAPGINKVWTFFRDVANIAIIGLFVFIAIGIILGLKEYGEKKLIARVLIVAILINFSFLFTRIITNVSNAVSNAVYTSIVAPNATASSDTASAASGIGDRFMQILKISTFQDTRNGLVKIYSDQNGGLGRMLLYSVMLVIFTLAAAGVFLYGALLLIARVVTLIFLLLTSSLAFSTYLLPSWAAMGWTPWWNQLIKNALLAPVLMLFLGAALAITQNITINGSIGTVLSGDIQGTSIEMMLSFFLILGILLAGLIIAHKLSTAAAMRITTALPAMMVGGAGAMLGYGFGWNNMRMKRFYEGELKKDLPSEVRSNYAAKLAGHEKALKRDWNLMNSTAAKKLATIPGLGGFAAGQSKSTLYGKAHEEKVKELANIYGKGAPKAEQLNAVREKATPVSTRAEERDKERLSIERERARSDERSASQRHQDAQTQLEELKRVANRLESAENGALANPTNAGVIAERDRLRAEHATQLSAAGGSIGELEKRVNAHLADIRAAQTTQTNHGSRLEALANLQKARGEKAAVDQYNEEYFQASTRGIFDPNVKAAAREKIFKYHDDHAAEERLKKLAGFVKGDDHGTEKKAEKKTDESHTA